jgi:hypothetical protein
LTFFRRARQLPRCQDTGRRRTHDTCRLSFASGAGRPPLSSRPCFARSSRTSLSRGCDGGARQTQGRRSRQAVLLVNIGEHSRSAKMSAALRHALQTAYCRNTPKMRAAVTASSAARLSARRQLVAHFISRLESGRLAFLVGTGAEAVHIARRQLPATNPERRPPANGQRDQDNVRELTPGHCVAAGKPKAIWEASWQRPARGGPLFLPAWLPPASGRRLARPTRHDFDTRNMKVRPENSGKTPKCVRPSRIPRSALRAARTPAQERTRASDFLCRRFTRVGDRRSGS